MTNARMSLLPDRGVIFVGGADARTLLQGLITNDMDQIKPGSALFAGLLAPQGKIIADFFIVPDGDGFLIDVCRERVKILMQRLTLYKLRAKVILEDRSETSRVIAKWNDLSSPGSQLGIAYTDPRHPDLGDRIITSDGSVAGQYSETDLHDTYDHHRITIAIPDGGKDYAYDDTYPHEAMYDDINGVSFTKGCYVGQEVVSRMQHRAATKKRIVIAESATQLPAPGTDITAGEINLGRLGSSIHKRGLALIRVDRLADVARAKADIQAGQSVLAISKPDWARYKLL